MMTPMNGWNPLRALGAKARRPRRPKPPPGDVYYITMKQGGGTVTIYLTEEEFQSAHPFMDLLAGFNELEAWETGLLNNPYRTP